MINKIPKSVGSKGVIKVMKGIDLVWEKSTIKTISWTISNQISPYANNLIVPKEFQSDLKDKQIISVKIGDLGEVSNGITNSIPYLRFSKSFDELLGTSDWIHAGTIITVTYK
ncbi:hypothetical protein [uncultured Anaerococcus sp.]|jgi:hypothetical protein|uniref:hypothetical protein n=1 Tax=uncultured Anaerococcus sp. TaxID=293428 RepID=UPI00205857E7|nr:hypothetical protein [uncultured Anaerococcus sp.]DAL53376.1 MAG TPA_asm: hypothetical protein [Caudoviricetes sp.]